MHVGRRLGSLQVALWLAPAVLLAVAVGVSPGRVRAQAAARQYIVNGQVATEADVRGTVAILDAPTGLAFCTGTLVDPTTVITAAHCVQREDDGALIDASSIRVVGGLLDLESDLAANLLPSVAVARVVGHCGYFDTRRNRGTGPNDGSGFGRGDDIAVLVLAAPYDGVTPTPTLPARRAAELALGHEVAMVGYGVYQLEPERSGTLYAGSTTVERLNAYEVLTARDRNGEGVDSCFGDSGGPLFWTDAHDVTYLVGVVSRGTSDSAFECGDGGIYTRPDGYEAFVQQAREDSAPTCRYSPPRAEVVPEVTLRGGAGCAVRTLPQRASTDAAWALLLMGLVAFARRRRPRVR